MLYCKRCSAGKSDKGDVWPKHRVEVRDCKYCKGIGMINGKHCHPCGGWQGQMYCTRCDANLGEYIGVR